MKHHIIVGAWLAAAVVASCTGGGGGTASIPFDPFGVEPSGATGDPVPGGTIIELCARACANIERLCPDSEGSDCATDCASSQPAGCESEFRAFVQCIAASPNICVNGTVNPSACTTQNIALSNCINGGGSAGTGSGGAGGTR